MQSESQHLPMPPVSSRDGNLRCPHCKMPSHRRSSEEISITVRVLHFGCTNTFCGHTWRATLSYEYGLVPSAIPAPEMADLPLRTPRRDDVMAAVRHARLQADGSDLDLNQMDLFETFTAQP